VKKTTTATTVRCDGETCIHAGVGPALQSLEAATRRGWLLSDDRDLCPQCKPATTTTAVVETLRATFYRAERHVADQREAHDAGLLAVAADAARNERERLVYAVQSVIDAQIAEVNAQIDGDGAAHPKAIGRKLGAEEAMQAIRTTIAERCALETDR
jgi:hypothetical protein